MILGAKALARTLIKPCRAGSQATLVLLKGDLTTTMTLTDRSLRKGSLVPKLIELGREVVPRM